MPLAFSATVTDFWGLTGASPGPSDSYRVVVGPGLRSDLLLTLLDVVDGPLVATVSPATAERLGVADGEAVGRDALRARIAEAGLELNGADLVSYLPQEAQRAVTALPPAPGTRVLTAADAPEFARFSADAPEDDLDEAYVELDHWVALGTFVDDRLVAVASMYPWRESTVADIGVITLPEYRGRGLGRRLVQALAAEALARGHEPQYRHQTGNAASAALARAAGFARFGEWDVVTA
ncbi:GNAT family N-acetyltransferase [Agromyces mangrovi Wang et al. 2018]|uniref:GNAT family N-acetyltransferase n=1 Tax=Agromyces mangrovi TaxID=1858653 RepID=UPI0025726515|nr:GNAT family N-acetyltransferase [Agromyces mangrovi]BDZ65706.1 putative acetyltransferase [Agromyces mangrovi]